MLEALVRIAPGPEEALAILRDLRSPTRVVLYGAPYADEVADPGVVGRFQIDWYAKAIAACRDKGTAGLVFDRYAGPDKPYAFAWESPPLEEFPQVDLTRTLANPSSYADYSPTLPAELRVTTQIPPEPAVTRILERLAAQIGDLFTEPSPSV